MARPDAPLRTSKFIMLASICVVVAALYFAQEFLIPLALAVLVSFLLAPVVRWLEHLRLPRAVSVLLAAALTFGALGGVGFVVYRQLTELSKDLSHYKDNIRQKLQSFHSHDGMLSSVRGIGEEVRQIVTGPPQRQASTQPGHPGEAPPVPVVVTNTTVPAETPAAPGSSPVSMLGETARAIFGPLGTAFIVIVFTIFMLLQREDLRDRVLRLVGRGHLMLTTQAMDDAAERVSRYLLMQSIINGSVGVCVMIGLWTVGKINGRPFPSPALWGLLAALLRFIPYIGIWISAAMPVLLSLAVFPTARQSLETLGVYVVIEIIAGNVGEPLLLGASTGLATLAVLVSATFWTWLWGPVGLLLSTPLTVCLVVIGKHVPQLEFLNIILGDEPPLNPPTRIYQRLLATDTEEALYLTKEYAAKMPLEELYDDVLLPALAMYEQDRYRERLDEEREQAVIEGMREIIEDMIETQHSVEMKAASEATVTRARVSDPSNVISAPEPRVEVKASDKGARVLPKGCVVNVICLPAQDEADELAALMLSHLLEMGGYCSITVSVTRLASEMLETVERTKSHVVCISALPPAAASHTRYLCKRLHGRFPDLNMIAGRWRSTEDLAKIRSRLFCGEQVQVVNSFKQAIAQVHQMAQPHLISQAEAMAVAEPQNSGVGKSEEPVASGRVL